MTKIYGVYKNIITGETTTEMELLAQHRKDTGRIGMHNGCLTASAKSWISNHGFELICNRAVRI